MSRLASFISAASNPKTSSCTTNRFYAITVLLIVFSTLVAGCSSEEKQAKLSAPVPSQSASPTPSPEQTTPQVSLKTPLLSSQTDPYPDASSKAIAAATISQSAQSSDDWKLVAQMWQEAITLMKSVSNTSSNYAVSQKKIGEYQRNLVYANKQATKPLPKAATVVTVQPTIQQASFSSVSTPSKPAASTAIISRQLPAVLPSVSTKPTTVINRQAPAVLPSASAKIITSKPKKSTAYDSERTHEASAKAFMDDYFEQTVDKGNKGLTSWCAKTFDLASSLYSPESAKILETWAASDGSMAWVKARIESSNGGGRPIRKNWKFSLIKGDTYLEKQLLKDGSNDSYKYSKSKYGGWCIQILTDI
jgi:hypothetical protein